MKTDTPEVDQAIVILLATSPNLPQSLETFINTFPEEHREQLALDYGAAIEQFTTIPMQQLQITQDLGAYNQSEMIKTADPHELQLLKCPTCGGVHFRHAGYMIALLPFVEKQEAKAGGSQVPVYVCVKDRTSFIHWDSKIQIVSDFIDLEAWEKFEKEASKAVGPGQIGGYGNC